MLLMIFGAAWAGWAVNARKGCVREPWHHTARAMLWAVVCLFRRG